MKCRVCGRTASINLRAYNTALCDQDFISFIEKRIFNTIKDYALVSVRDKPLVAVSGGKDSLSLWYVLNTIGYPCDGFYIDLGIEEYSRISREKVKHMADQLKRRVYIFSVYEHIRKGIDGLAKTMRRPPCSACGIIKRYVMNRVCIEKGYTVLATGHNLDDEASALLGNILFWKEEHLWKKSITLPGIDGHLVKKVKPLFLCSEREMAAYAILNGIDYIYEECPFSVDAKTILYKRMLNVIEEESPGMKLQFLKGYMNRMVKDGEKTSNYCLHCGYPSYGDTCSVCRMFRKLGIETTISFEEYIPILDSERKEVT